MGMSGDANGCGACSKYCLFAVNFVVFVSKTGCKFFVPNTISDSDGVIFSSVLFNRLADWYCSDWAYGRWLIAVL